MRRRTFGRLLPGLALGTALRAYGAPESPAAELRGVYMELSGSKNFGVFPLVPNSHWREFFARLKALGVNAVFPNAVSPAGAFYPSDVVSRVPPKDCLFSPDLLDEITDAAHGNGIEVHVWTIEWYKAPRDTHPDRLVHDSAGKTAGSYCPSVHENRELMRRMLIELARRYAVDGIQYDYIRFPEGGYCYCRHCREGFEKKLGRKVDAWPADVLENGPLAAPYLDYLCGLISSFVEEMHPLLKKARRGLVISAAVWCNDKSARNEGVRQDWGLWASKGWLDFVAPMNYGNEWIVKNFEQYARNEAKQLSGTVPPVFGLGAYQDTPEGEVAQVRLGRELDCAGFIVYTLTGRIMDEVLPVLARQVWNRPAAVPAFGRNGLAEGI